LSEKLGGKKNGLGKKGVFIHVDGKGGGQTPRTRLGPIGPGRKRTVL